VNIAQVKFGLVRDGVDQHIQNLINLDVRGAPCLLVRQTAAWVVSEPLNDIAPSLHSNGASQSQPRAACEAPTIIPEGNVMHMSSESLIVILVIGVIAGWLAGEFVDGTGFGLLGDLIIGIIGAFIGDWLMPRLGLNLGAGLVAAIANATIGAIVLLLIIRLFRSGGRWAGGWTGGWNRRWR
jgi:uncharacterized membrane protein YeaQ/YmgE (transglycosylase-associated protein family)